MSDRPLIEIDPEGVRGELPDVIFDVVDWDRLHWYVQEALLAQKHEVRKLVMDAGTPGERGLRIDIAVKPFDAEGFTLVSVAGQPILRLHVTRLLLGSPLRLDEMRKFEEEE